MVFCLISAFARRPLIEFGTLALCLKTVSMMMTIGKGFDLWPEQGLSRLVPAEVLHEVMTNLPDIVCARVN